MSYRIEMSEVQGSEMEIFLYEPEGDGPHPGWCSASIYRAIRESRATPSR